MVGKVPIAALYLSMPYKITRIERPINYLWQTMNKFFTSKILLGLILFNAYSVAHCRVQSDESIIAHLKQENVSSIDSQLASMPYESWLKKILGSSATIKWVVDDCGEGANGNGVWPLCVTAMGNFNEHGEVTISIAVGRSDKGAFGKPSLFNIYIEGVGASRHFDSLHQLPDYLRDSKEENNSAPKFSDKPLDEQSAVDYAKNIDIRIFAPAQPSQKLLRWIETLAANNTIVKWKLEGCDRVAISMQLNGNRDYRACVEAHFENEDESVLVSIIVGTYRKGLAVKPKVNFVQVYNKRRNNITTPPISELPEKLADMRRGGSAKK